MLLPLIRYFTTCDNPVRHTHTYMATVTIVCVYIPQRRGESLLIPESIAGGYVSHMKRV